LGSGFGLSQKLDPDPDSGTGTAREHRRRRELLRKIIKYTQYSGYIGLSGRRENSAVNLYREGLKRCSVRAGGTNV
jgi:hypothetical protein